MSNIYEKLSNIQQELKAPKGQRNSFGNYNYRSCEDILEAVKPLCLKNKCSLILNDTLENIGDRYYIKATARLIDIEDGISSVENNAYAREEEVKKGMDGSQITGTASSYARKYALNGLFNIDDTKDADTDAYTKRTREVIEITDIADEITANESQLKLIKTLVKDIPALLTFYKIDKLEDLTMNQAKEIIERKNK